MAIKAIINNTEKEIEQIKNSNEQDIDYVYSRIGDTEVEGEPPISIKSIGENLANYRIYGNTVDGESAGDRTGNLFDEKYENIPENLPIYEAIYVGDGYFTLSTTAPLNANSAANLFLMSGDVQIGASTATTGVWSGHNGTVESVNGYITVAYRYQYSVDPRNYKTMLNEGSTALPYEPYGYKVPVTVEGKNLYEITKFANGSVSQTVSGITFTISNNKVIYSGTSTATYPQILSPELPLIPGQSYYAKIIVKGSYEGQIYIYFRGSQVEGGTKQNYKQILPGTEEVFTVWYNTCVLYVAQGNTRHFDASVEVVITKVPSVTTPIYLPEPIKMVGDEAEYVDYKEQKMHRVRKNLLNDKLSLNATLGTLSSEPPILGFPQSIGENRRTYFLTVAPGEQYTISMSTPGDRFGICGYYNIVDPHEYTTGNKLISDVVILPIVLTSVPSTYTFTVPNNVVMVAIYYSLYTQPIQIQIEKGSTATPYEPYIENTDVDVTLPALSTIKGTNTFSVNTSIQPSNIYIKDSFDYKKVFTATRTVEGESPLNYRSIEDSDSTLKSYRIYGNTVNGESVGDRTANLWDETIIQGGTNNTGTIADGNPKRLRSDYIFVEPGETYSFASNLKIRLIYSYDDNNQKVSLIRDAPIGDISYTFTVPNAATKIIITVMKRINNVEYNITPDDFEWGQLEKGSVVTSYEPYGYRVPVTVTNGTDTQTTNLYLPEPIKMVGDEAEYIDYAEQKQHRVRKNLLPNTATSQTINGVTFTVNSDGSVTCNGTASNAIYFSFATNLESGTYKISGTPRGMTENNAVIFINANYSTIGLSNNVIDNDGNGKQFVATQSGTATLTITIKSGYTCNNLTFYPMIRLASIADDTYEPYIENTELDVTLPALPVLPGTNTLSVETEAQPSDIYLKGKIKKKPKIYYKIYYYSQDGQTLLYTESVLKGSNGMYSGTPTKMADPQYTYTFAGWSSSTGQTTATPEVRNNIQNDKNVYAAFSQTLNTYTVYFYNESDTPIETVQNVPYGGTAVYSGNPPTKAETAQYTYTFIGWNSNSSASTADDNALTNVTADRTVYAIFTAVPKGYTVYFYNGETLLETVTGVPSGGTATYTGATPTSSQVGYIFSGWSPSNTDITADTSCYAQFVDEDMYESISDTWSEIIANVSNGTYSTKYHIGDTKKIDLGTEGEVIMTIVGIDADDLADNSGKAPMTWISKQLLKTSHRMNPSKQSGTSGTGTLGGWAACEMRNYLINTIKPLLPSEVRNALKTVKKYSRIYNTSETAVYNVVSNDDIWIPSVYEVNFTGYETSGVTYSTAFPDNASRIKHKVSDPAEWWWLRSASGTNSFGIVSGDGGSYTSYASDSHGVAVGFCLGAPTYTVTYYSQDGQTVLSTETVEEGHDCTYSTVPTKESDTDFDYTFTGWSTTTNQSSPTSGATTNIQQDTNLYAAFSKSFKTDTISDSWKDIITACNNGTYSGKYQVGDLKTIDVGTEGPVQMQIVAIDTDLLASDNTKKAPITWISKQLLNTYKTMHRTPSNYLSDWANCDMRTYLRGTILPMLPSVVQNGIKEVTKYTCKRTSSTTWTTVSATENIWLPSYREVSNATSNCETSGVQYNSIFTDNASRVKSKAGNSAYYWWTRSASGNSNSVYWYCFAGVDSNGSADYGGYYCTLPSGVAIGFCT